MRLMRREGIKGRRNETGKKLALALNPEGFWKEQRVSGPLAAALAVMALFFDDSKKNRIRINRGLGWLEAVINADGSFGNFSREPGNVITSLLVYTAVDMADRQKKRKQFLKKRITGYLFHQGVDLQCPGWMDNLLKPDGQDAGLSLAVLSLIAPGNNASPRRRPVSARIPFEWGLFPGLCLRYRDLRERGYVLPAQLAAGIFFQQNQRSSPFRRFFIHRRVHLLQRLMPANGGFSDAVPLTAFIAMSLLKTGYRESRVVKSGIAFLRQTQRKDGSWPMETDRSTQVTAQTVNAFGRTLNGFLTTDRQDQIADHFRLIQRERGHPFKGQLPGGWCRTQAPGAVPDGESTAGAILALLKLQPEGRVQKEVLGGCAWLRRLVNRDGGISLFFSKGMKGWAGRSGVVLTAHHLLAVSAVIERYAGALKKRDRKQLEQMFKRAVEFLEGHQEADGSWSGFFAGDGFSVSHFSPVYGTARVLAFLKDASGHARMDGSLRQQLVSMGNKASSYLTARQLPDGSWGATGDAPGKTEETAMAVTALASLKTREQCLAGLQWLATREGEYLKMERDGEVHRLGLVLEAFERMLELPGGGDFRREFSG